MKNIFKSRDSKAVVKKPVVPSFGYQSYYYNIGDLLPENRSKSK
jgi:hypothetical protein